jgi:hypothetical protein
MRTPFTGVQGTLVTSDGRKVGRPRGNGAGKSMSEQEGNGLSLEGLAHRLEALERENTELRSKVATLEGSDTRRDGEAPASEEFAGRVVSRRALLSKAGATALGAVAAGALLLRDTRDATAQPDDIHADGVFANFAQLATYNHDAAVTGLCLGSAAQYGVHGVTDANGQAGVRGEGGTGVWGRSEKNGYSGVYGQHTGSGFGVVGDGRGSGRAGVLGRNSTGYGGTFQGGQAQLKLEPGKSAGKPTTGAHTKGELYMDSEATLFVCTASASPGTWRRLTTTAA